MSEVPKLRQRIAGKSIPLEKFVARKARKCESQGGRLVLPALEIAYVLHAVSRAPRAAIAEHMLPRAEAALAELGRYEKKPEEYPGQGKGSSSGVFWDDWCLARHLEGVCLRYIAYPVRGAQQSVCLSIPSTGIADTLVVVVWCFLFGGRVLMPSWIWTRSRRFLSRKLRSVLAPRSKRCSRMGPRLSWVITWFTLPVSRQVAA